MIVSLPSYFPESGRANFIFALPSLTLSIWGERIVDEAVFAAILVMVLVLPPAEQQLPESIDGKDLVKKMRATLIDKARPLLYQVVGDITGSKILDLHTDISTESGERFFVFALENNLEKTLARKKDS